MIEQLTIESQKLRLIFLPRYGGKISSLVELSTGEEFLLPPAAPYGQCSDHDFATSDRGGFDECLPSISQCSASDTYPAIPDHGELWCRSWQVLDHTRDQVTLRAQAPSGLELTRRAVVRDRAVDLNYRLRNTSAEDRAWIWSSHPLLKVEQGDSIHLPGSVSQATVSYSSLPALAEADRVDWPVTMCADGPVHLDVVGAADGKTAHKLFVRSRPEGWCALHRVRLKRSLRMDFSADEIPWIGLWISLGAWPVHSEARQYTVALEPTTAPTDSLAEAVAAGTADLLTPGQSRSWSMSLSVLPWDNR